MVAWLFPHAHLRCEPSAPSQTVHQPLSLGIIEHQSSLQATCVVSVSTSSPLDIFEPLSSEPESCPSLLSIIEHCMRATGDRAIMEIRARHATIDRARTEWDLVAQPQAHELTLAQPTNALTMPHPRRKWWHRPSSLHLVADLPAQVTYLECVMEQMQRALAARGDTHPNTWSNSAAAFMDDELHVKIGLYILSSTVYSREDEYDEEDPAVERCRRYKSAMKCERKGKGKDVAQPLQERISFSGEQPHQLGETHLPDTSTMDLINLGQEFPPSPPEVEHLNPFTGQEWTLQEVLFYPRGIPNWPSIGTSKISKAERIGFPIGTTSMVGEKYDRRINGNRPHHEKDVHLVRDMDRSRRLLPWTMIETRDA
ncbi:hypothetical protein BDW22DRAFT_1345814 [Trametopsis cervina]|nr:hypothetical protein BDW22DRAFT_1345814 [Trametopsis cervina]